MPEDFVGLADLACAAAAELDGVRLGHPTDLGKVALLASRLRAAFPPGVESVLDGRLDVFALLPVAGACERAGCAAGTVGEVVRAVRDWCDRMSRAVNDNAYDEPLLRFCLDVSRAFAG
jgi:hypothetical protein